MEKKMELTDELLDQVAGGTDLPKDWKSIIDANAQIYLNMYKGITYEEACKLIQSFLTDPEDVKLVCEYIKKYFPNNK